MKRFALAFLMVFGLTSSAEAQLFPEPVYLVNPNSISSGVMGTSASPMVTTATIDGNVTPADGYANPTTAVQAYSLGGIFNGTTWDRARTASSASATTGTGLRGAGILGQYNTVAPTFTNGQFGMIQIDATGIMQTNEAVFSAANITTATTTTVKGTGPGWLKRVIVGVAGAGSTFAVYNIASAGCTGTPASGLQGTYDSSAIRVVDFDLRLSLGICVVTTATAPNLTVIYK